MTIVDEIRQAVDKKFSEPAFLEHLLGVLEKKEIRIQKRTVQMDRTLFAAHYRKYVAAKILCSRALKHYHDWYDYQWANDTIADLHRQRAMMHRQQGLALLAKDIGYD